MQISFIRLATRSLGSLPAAPLALATQYLLAFAPFNDAFPVDFGAQALGLCAYFGLAGDGTVDAWIAAHAIALNAPLASFDRGFVKYARVAASRIELSTRNRAGQSTPEALALFLHKVKAREPLEGDEKA